VKCHLKLHIDIDIDININITATRSACVVFALSLIAIREHVQWLRMTSKDSASGSLIISWCQKKHYCSIGRKTDVKNV